MIEIIHNLRLSVDIANSVHIISIRVSMKKINLILILVMIVCYSGLCWSTATFASFNDSKTESCHEMNNHHSSQENNQLIQNNNYKADNNTACCFDSLINNKDENCVKVFAIIIPTVFISDPIVFKSQPGINNFSLREHDPPDLQVLHSTFQI